MPENVDGRGFCGEPVEAAFDASPVKVAELQRFSAEDLVRWALDTFQSRVALASSFQAEESVLIDIAYQLKGSNLRVFMLDSGRLHQKTYDCMEALKERYGIKVAVFFPGCAKGRADGGAIRGQFVLQTA